MATIAQFDVAPKVEDQAQGLSLAEAYAGASALMVRMAASNDQSGSVRAHYEQRLDLARQIGQDPDSYDQLYRLNPALLRSLAADQKDIGGGDPMDGRRLETLMERRDQSGQLYVETDRPVEEYLHGREKLRKLIAGGGDPEDVRVLMVHQAKQAQAIYGDDGQLSVLGERGRTDLVRELGGFAGAKIDNDRAKASGTLGNEWLAQHGSVRAALDPAGTGSYDPSGRGFADADKSMLKRAALSGDVKADRFAIAYIAQEAKARGLDLTDVRAKYVGDVVASGIVQPGPRGQSQIESITEAMQGEFDKRFAGDVTKEYAELKRILYQSEVQPGVSNVPAIVALRQMLNKSVDRIRQDPDAYRRLGEDPETKPFMAGFVQDAASPKETAKRHEQKTGELAGAENGKDSAANANAGQSAEEGSVPFGGPWQREPKESIARFVERHGAFHSERMKAVLTDKNATFFALPTSSFAPAGATTDYLKRLSDHRLQTLYRGNVELLKALQENPVEYNSQAGKLAHDRLELGRRVMGVQLLKRGVLSLDEIDKDATPLVSEAGKSLNPEFRCDPKSFIQKSELEKRKSLYKDHLAPIGSKAIAEGKRTVGKLHGHVDRMVNDLVHI